MEATAGATRAPGQIAVTDRNENLVVLPRVEMPAAPDAGLLWQRAFVAAYVLLGLFFLDRISLLLSNYWILEALGYEDVFWTNFRMGATVFVVTLVAFTAVSAAPAFLYDVGARGRRLVLAVVVFDELIAAYLMSQHYQTFLGFFNGRAFGVDDPVFGNDIGFYVFDLPAYWAIVRGVQWMLVLGLIASIFCSYAAHRRRGAPLNLPWGARLLAVIATPYTLILLGALGVVGAIDLWLRRFDLLIRNNEESWVFTGAEAIDVTGFLSTRNDYILTALVVLGITGAIIFLSSKLRQAAMSTTGDEWRRPVRTAALVVVALLVLDVAFKAGVTVRDELAIQPNEPVAQDEFLQRHIDSTLAAYGLSDIETVAYTPNAPGAPLPDVDEMLQSPTLRNAPLWPGFVASLEGILDPQHTERLLLTGGDPTIYGPTIDAFRQEQQLRPYYDFLDIDTVRYMVDGEPRLFASAVRETPVDPYAPMPWLLHWSQQHLVYTHGYGLVMIPLDGVGPDGGPTYMSSQIPSQTTVPGLEVETPFVYFGEANEAMAFTNLSEKVELNTLPGTDAGDTGLPPEVGTGVPVDSLLKRLVFGWRTENTLQVLFSDLIQEESEALYYRIPIERLEQIAPFIHFDTDAYATATDGEIVWMVNGMTYSDRYPYSRLGELGDKSQVRSPITRPVTPVNYIEDSVKATVNAYTGEVRIYKWADGPVIDTWADIYPDLFVDADEMPAEVREQVQYPSQLYHIQFDDIWWQYHMGEALPFFSADDIWDDADEVLGPMLGEGEMLSFSIEPYYWLAEAGGPLPASSTGTQFVMSQVFTPESAINLQAIATVYQTGDDYGKLTVLEVPKGHFVPGPEQADAAIDQDPEISQQFAWWNRLGNEVIRGHTSALVVGDELIYVEPIYIRSAQNPLPQLKQVVVVFRGQAAMGETLDEALRLAVEEAGGPTDEVQAVAFPGFRIDP